MSQDNFSSKKTGHQTQLFSGSLVLMPVVPHFSEKPCFPPCPLIQRAFKDLVSSGVRLMTHSLDAQIIAYGGLVSRPILLKGIAHTDSQMTHTGKWNMGSVTATHTYKI